MSKKALISKLKANRDWCWKTGRYHQGAYWNDRLEKEVKK